MHHFSIRAFPVSFNKICNNSAHCHAKRIVTRTENKLFKIWNIRRTDKILKRIPISWHKRVHCAFCIVLFKVLCNITAESSIKYPNIWLVSYTLPFRWGAYESTKLLQNLYIINFSFSALLLDTFHCALVILLYENKMIIIARKILYGSWITLWGTVLQQNATKKNVWMYANHMHFYPLFNTKVLW